MKEQCQKNQHILVIDDSESIHEDFRAILGSTDADKCRYLLNNDDIRIATKMGLNP